MTKIKFDNLKNKNSKKMDLWVNQDNRKSFIYTVAISLSLLLISISAIVARVNQIPETLEQVKSEDIVESTNTVEESVVTISTKEPSEEIPAPEYTVAADMPRSISLPTISVNGFIQQVGIDQDNKIAVPNNIHMVGWYIHSVKPGEKGLSIIDGHVDGMYSGGIFYDLNKVSVGDEYSIVYGDGSEIHYRVVDKIQVSEAESNNVLFSKRPDIESQLNLITCIGTYSEDLESYDQRLIVVSEKI